MHFILSHLISSSCVLTLNWRDRKRERQIRSLNKVPSLQLLVGSLLLAQVDVQDSTHEKQGDAQPRQDETVAKVSFVQDS